MEDRRMSAGDAESRGESAAPPASKARGREEVRAAVLAAAGELFAERGPSAVSVRDIASLAGVNHGLIHRHFGSKEGLLRETLELMAGEIAEQMPRSGTAGSRSEAGPNGEMGYRMLDHEWLESWLAESDGEFVAVFWVHAARLLAAKPIVLG